MHKILSFNLLLLNVCVVSCVTSRSSAELSSVTSKSSAQSGVAWENLSQVKSATFDGANIAWLVTAREGAILRTENGGSSWNKVPANTVGGFDSISFIDAQRGWAISKDAQAQVWRTTDGGRTWIAIAKMRVDELDTNFLSSVQMKFVDASHGWIIETFSIWRTEDGGISWKKGDITSRSEVKGQPVRGSFVNAWMGWIHSSEGEVFRTKDGGKTWHVSMVAADVDLTDIIFIDERNGWLSGTNGKLYCTINGGETWQPLSVASNNTVISSVHFVSKKEGWAVGYIQQADTAPRAGRGLVLHTTDGGLNWTNVQVGENEPFFDRVYFAGAQHGWLFARDNVYRTEDGGQTWRIVLNLTSIKKAQG